MTANPSTQKVAASKAQAWRLFIETSARLQTTLDDELRAHCRMSLADYHVLLILHESPGGRARMRDLSHRMVFSTSRLSYQVDAMVRRGWLRREAAPEDKRGSYAVLTDDGRSAFAAAARDHGAAVERLFTSGLSDVQASELADLMAALTEHLDAETPITPSTSANRAK
ncbi:MarR family winged helix-turn-helix transcriptional regulator [Gordonia jacobaea]|uniref:MarR family winged helix-turn-helix transcriptional regulator n=1 Tax=Gordonia jacobaea TaxID=122202 RepID=UPI0022E95338|nr:MarR family transcriptional regulator [Gordonia jacobaea]